MPWSQELRNYVNTQLEGRKPRLGAQPRRLLIIICNHRLFMQISRQVVFCNVFKFCNRMRIRTL